MEEERDIEVGIREKTNDGEPLGLEDGWVPTRAFTASTQLNLNHRPDLARLNSKSGWSAKRDNKNQWLQVDLGAETQVNQVLTQGRQDVDHWVKEFTVGYSNDGIQFHQYRSKGAVKKFRGNSDRNTVVKNIFNPPITARYIQIYPSTWHRHISMRMELKGKGQTQLNHCPVSVDLGFVIDGSKGAKAENFDLQKHFIKQVVSTFTIARHQTHIGLVTYSNKAKVEMSFNWLNSYSEAEKIIDKITFPNHLGQRVDLGLGAAYKSMHINQNPEFIQRSIVAIMNPKAIKSRLWYLINIKRAIENKGIKVFLVVIGGRRTDLKQKLQLTNSDTIFFVPSFKSLATNAAHIANVICNHQHKESDPFRSSKTLRGDSNSIGNMNEALEEILV